MRRRWIAATLVVSLAGCEFAVKHPPAAAAITGGVIGLGACELDGPSQTTCAIIGGGAALLLGPEDTDPHVVDPILLVPDNDRPVHVPTRRLPPRTPSPSPIPSPSDPAPPVPAPAPPSAPPPTEPSPPSP